MINELNEEKYFNLFMDPVKKSMDYKPKFGKGNIKNGFTLDEFKNLYGQDPFYSWIGLDSNLMYSAHRAAGGMTSIYRQIGIGCEHLFRQIIIDSVGYSDDEFAFWSYSAKTKSGKKKTLSLDARLELREITNTEIRDKVEQWILSYIKELSLRKAPENGIVFEVRQGYKSKDSKRQNADIDNAAVSWANGYLPVFAIFSSQIDSDIVLRYKNSRSGILTGTMINDPLISLYTFTKEILNFDLAGFFKRNSKKIREETNIVLENLLKAQ